MRFWNIFKFKLRFCFSRIEVKIYRCPREFSQFFLQNPTSPWRSLRLFSAPGPRSSSKNVEGRAERACPPAPEQRCGARCRAMVLLVYLPPPPLATSSFLSCGGLPTDLNIINIPLTLLFCSSANFQDHFRIVTICGPPGCKLSKHKPLVQA